MNFVTKEPIDKGWSKDKKYCITDENGTRYLLRVSDIAEYDTKKSEFDMMKQVAALGVPMCLPIEFGTCEDGVYSIQSWIDGEDAEEVISRYSDTEQYVFGIEAGRILRKIHSIPAPSTVENWESRFNRKMDYKIQRYNECPYKYDNGQAFIDYIEANRHLLHGRPQTYQHGDYHIGNMMIGNDGELYIIDFNRNDFGDPWEESNRIVWCAGKAPYFASGIVNGYFDNAVPLEFWKLLALYISSNTLSSLPWAIPFGESEVEKFQEQAKEVLEWYDGMKNPVPSWYFGTEGKIITLCGSIKFCEDFEREKARLTAEGQMVLSVERFDLPKDIDESQIRLLKDIHKRKIDVSDEIFVINKNGYIGESTLDEIAYAQSKGKLVKYMENRLL